MGCLTKVQRTRIHGDVRCGLEVVLHCLPGLGTSNPESNPLQ
jgi:hypothetical protein